LAKISLPAIALPVAARLAWLLAIELQCMKYGYAREDARLRRL
jgi:hypothetical protein